MVEYGADVSSAPWLPPSILNWTPATATLSEALAVRDTPLPETVAPLLGAVMLTVGGVVSQAEVFIGPWSATTLDSLLAASKAVRPIVYVVPQVRPVSV